MEAIEDESAEDELLSYSDDSEDELVEFNVSEVDKSTTFLSRYGRSISVNKKFLN